MERPGERRMGPFRPIVACSPSSDRMSRACSFRARTPAGVLDAAAALVQPGRAGDLSGSWAILTGREVLSADLRDPSWADDSATFDDLGAESYTLSGTGSQQMSLTFPRPAGWLLSVGAHLILDVSVSGEHLPGRQPVADTQRELDGIHAPCGPAGTTR